MASVTLLGVYLAPLSDLSDRLILNAGVSVSDVGSTRSEFRTYANGRVRMLTRPGRARSVSVSVARVDRATRERLDALAGVTVLLRDGRGRKHYGVFPVLAADEQPGLPFCSLSLTLTEITFPEAV